MRSSDYRNRMNNGLFSLILATNLLEATSYNGIPGPSHSLMGFSKDDGSLPKRKSQKIKQTMDRELSPAEIARTMAKAKKKGLPDGWTFEFDRKRGVKKWISPFGGRKCDSIPQAIRMSVRLGLIPAKPLSVLDEEKVASEQDEDNEEKRDDDSSGSSEKQWLGNAMGEEEL